MFRTIKKEKQLDMSTSISGMLKGTACEQFHNGQARHNMFSEQMVHRINENLCSSPFSVNAWDLPMPLIRVLLGMMALKKAFGWSDSELFEHWRFDLLIRSAIELFYKGSIMLQSIAGEKENKYYSTLKPAFENHFYMDDHGKQS